MSVGTNGSMDGEVNRSPVSTDQREVRTSNPVSFEQWHAKHGPSTAPDYVEQQRAGWDAATSYLMPEIQRLKAALRTVGDDYPGSSCQTWCHQQADGGLPVETSPDEELRKRATRLIVAMRRDHWEGHDHGYANDLAALLNVGSPLEPAGKQDAWTEACPEGGKHQHYVTIEGPAPYDRAILMTCSKCNQEWVPKVGAQVKASAPAWDCACNELDCPYCANRNALNEEPK